MADFQLPRAHVAAPPARIIPGARRASNFGDVGTLLRLQATAGNHAVQRLIPGIASPPVVAIQRLYEPRPIEERELNLEVPKKWPETNAADAKTLVQTWCTSHKQFMSLVNNLTWAQFLALTVRYPNGLALSAVKSILAKVETDRNENFRVTGECGTAMDGTAIGCPAMSYDTYCAQGILKVSHTTTFRTAPETRGTYGLGRYTRNFTATVNGKPAAWQIHVHYAGRPLIDDHPLKGDLPQNAHSKLNAGGVNVVDLGVASGVVAACNTAVIQSRDNAGRNKNNW